MNDFPTLARRFVLAVTVTVTVAVALATASAATKPAEAAGTDRAPDRNVQRAILVTGASTGIGRYVTERLARDGHFVYAGARKEADLAALGAIRNVQPLRLDVTDPAQIAAAVQTITEAGRGLYGLVNNAGVVISGPLAETSDADFDFVMQVNTYGPFRVTRAFTPLIVAARGRITTIGSISGILSPPDLGVYSMSKHAVEAFTDSLAAQLAPLGVAVSVIEPGNYNSEIVTSATRRLGKPSPLGDRSQYKPPDEVAEAVSRALFEPNPRRRYLTVPNQREAEFTIRQAVRELVQLNEGQAYTYDRAALLRMLDDALAKTQDSAVKPGSVFRDCADCPQMVVIPAGTFTMGSPDDEAERDPDEGPQRQVAIPRPLAVSKFEVTRGEFAQFVRETGYVAGNKCFVWTGSKEEHIAGKSWQAHNFPQTDAHPVVCIAFDDARAYIAWLGRKSGKPYRFLSEAEWEYAARAGARDRFSFGNDPEELCRHGNVADATARDNGGPAKWQYTACSDGYGMTTAPVGSFAANGFGLHDMHGNVWEWLGDCYRDTYTGAPSDGSMWLAEPCTKHAVRGGGWSYAPKFNRSADRNGDPPAVYGSNLGLRIARTL